jgi:hypothetical protein
MCFPPIRACDALPCRVCAHAFEQGGVHGNGDESSLVIKGGVEPPHSIRNVEQVQRSDQQIYRGDSAIGDE